MKKLLLFAIVVLGFSAASFGQSSATASTTAILVTPISIINDVPMNFGKIGASNEGGSVALGFDDVLTPDGSGVTIMSDGNPTTAVFTVTGDDDRLISVNYTTTIITLVSENSDELEVSDIIADCGESGENSNLVDGTLIIKIGATLTIPADAEAGTYENEDDLFVTVNYE